MCGITGFLNLSGAPASLKDLNEMTSVIAHRGPDGSGRFIDHNLALGHRRLAIIDLSTSAKQPMKTLDGRYIITFNGEIYNFRELKRELVKKGHNFFSNSDTEVLLNGFVEWGTSVLKRLNGMFAFAIWDSHKKNLILARDRFGVKPLYYCNTGKTFLFASEAKAILKHPSAKAELNKEGLLEYFTFQNFFTDNTIFKSIQILPHGCFMQISESGQNIHRYWDYNFEEPENPYSDTRYLDELDHLFQQAVSRQLVADVEVGAYLSGGIDSGSITAIASKSLPYMRTFTCGFDLNSISGIELTFDERPAAEYMSYLFKTEHYEMVLKAGDMERALPNLVYHLEEPRVGQSYPNYYAAKLASKFNKVVLAGTGGDELFGGYPWRYYRAIVNNNFDDYVDKYFNYWQRLIPEVQLKDVFAPIWSDIAKVDMREIFRNVFVSHADQISKPEDYLNHSLYFEAKTFLHSLFVVEDKLSMAHSIETRVPFMDNDLVDFAMRLPAHLKLGNLKEVVRLDENIPGSKTAKYFQKTNDGKLVLRKMMKRHLPKEVTEREKQGFSAPDASWFKGESIEYVRSIVHNKNSKIFNYFETSVIQKMVDEHLSGSRNRRLLIWSLLNVENIFREFDI